MSATTNIPPPPKIGTSLAAVVEWLWQLYRALALEPRSLRGSVTIEGDAIGATVTIGVTLPDADYEVVIDGRGFTGAPAADAFRVTTKTYSATDFSFILAAAPGTGNSVTLSWILVR